ncbi:hypothetical protein ACFORL_03620 [Legionella dresdenensis]|uniref:Inclusion membrane protein A n=1 Tax=Legionella dresdenensis TaxID=450200 RepID=A0ABV8CD83_9GAMM
MEFLDSILAHLGNLKDWIGDKAASIKDWCSEKWGDFKEWCSDLWDDFTFANVMDWFRQKGIDLKDWFKECWNELAEFAKDRGNWFVLGFAILAFGILVAVGFAAYGAALLSAILLGGAAAAIVALIVLVIKLIMDNRLEEAETLLRESRNDYYEAAANRATASINAKINEQKFQASEEEKKALRTQIELLQKRCNETAVERAKLSADLARNKVQPCAAPQEPGSEEIPPVKPTEPTIPDNHSAPAAETTAPPEPEAPTISDNHSAPAAETTASQEPERPTATPARAVPALFSQSAPLPASAANSEEELEIEFDSPRWLN